MKILYGVYGYNVNVWPLPSRVLLAVFDNKCDAEKYYNYVCNLDTYVSYKIDEI